MKFPIMLLLIIALTYFGKSQTSNLSEFRWTSLDAKGKATGRHENAFVEYKGKFYLMGGRGINPVDVFDPSTNSWESKSNSPMEIHHFQAVVYHDAIYLMGAMSGHYPKETPLDNIWIYYPEKDEWEKGAIIPENRRRGGAGAVLYNDKIYMACGIEYGHTSGTNNYFDCYNPKTGEWTILTKAPHIRDHFPAIVVNNKLYCIGGRNTSVHYSDNFGAFFNATVPYVDVYDFAEEKWTTLKNKIPFPTAAGGLVNIGNNLIYIGGEGLQKQAYNQTQCLNLETGEWSQLAALNIGRHGSGAILYQDRIYLAAGSPLKGGGNMNSIEMFSADHNWKKLFNGKNLDGWEIKCLEQDKNKKYWTVKDGAIDCNTQGNKDHSYIWLQSTDEFSDFELRFKFAPSKENKGNTGIQIRSRWDANAKIPMNKGALGWMDGPQIDIDPTESWRNGFIYDETRETRRWINPSLPDWNISKEKYAPKKWIQYFDDENTGWNDMTIICIGNKIVTYVNNILVSNYDGTGIIDAKDHKKYNVGKKGHLAIQLHMRGANKIRFKDIEIREFE